MQDAGRRQRRREYFIQAALAIALVVLGMVALWQSHG
jgi:predicted nucleic acid-binding Zn ribbon protein